MTSITLVHVGYHKTATTWMQSLLFTPEHGYRQIASHGDVFRHIVQPHGFDFDPGPMRDLVAERIAAITNGSTPVISSEILCGHPFWGGHESDVYAERLRQIVPNARILISIRNQERILPSVYMQYILRGGTMPPEIFFSGTNEPGYLGFMPKQFEYDRLVSLYQTLFGRENVFVLTQESLKNDMAEASLCLARFAGNEAFTKLSESARRVLAPSYPEAAVPILRRINHIQKSTLNPWPVIALGRTPQGLFKVAGYAMRNGPVGKMLVKRTPISDHVRKRFAGFYTPSNERLRNLIQNSEDLAGYP